MLDCRPMRPLLAPVLFAFLTACGGEPQDTSPEVPDPTGGQCGAVTEHDILIRARVVDQVTGAAVAGAELRLVEDTWHNPEKVWGSGITGADGVGEFTANRVVAVEDCWGVALNYNLLAQLGERIGEDALGFNSSINQAITDGSNTADVTSFPIELPP